MRALRHVDTYLRRMLPVFAVITAGAIGTAVPGPVAAAVGFFLGGLTLVLMRNRVQSVQKAIPEWMADQDVGLSLAIVRFRDGTWWPECIYKPSKLQPDQAVALLHQAADQIADDWNLSTSADPSR